MIEELASRFPKIIFNYNTMKDLGENPVAHGAIILSMVHRNLEVWEWKFIEKRKFQKTN